MAPRLGNSCEIQVLFLQWTLLKKELLKQEQFIPNSGWIDKASATETVDSGSIPGRVKIKDYKNWYSQLPCLTFNN